MLRHLLLELLSSGEGLRGLPCTRSSARVAPVLQRGGAKGQEREGESKRGR